MKALILLFITPPTITFIICSKLLNYKRSYRYRKVDLIRQRNMQFDLPIEKDNIIIFYSIIKVKNMRCYFCYRCTFLLQNKSVLPPLPIFHLGGGRDGKGLNTMNWKDFELRSRHLETVRETTTVWSWV